jgi:hypothetical protein
MKPLYKILAICSLILLLSLSLGKTVHESFYSISDYNNLGCNGDTLDSCVKNNGMSWCAKNCRNANPDSYCNGDNWKGCLKHNKQSWCENNCKDKDRNLYKVGLSNIL